LSRGYWPAPKKLYTTKCEFSGKIEKEDFVIKTSKFTKEQIAFTLKQAELGTPVKEVIDGWGTLVTSVTNLVHAAILDVVDGRRRYREKLHKLPTSLSVGKNVNRSRYWEDTPKHKPGTLLDTVNKRIK